MHTFSPFLYNKSYINCFCANRKIQNSTYLMDHIYPKILSTRPQAFNPCHLEVLASFALPCAFVPKMTIQPWWREARVYRALTYLGITADSRDWHWVASFPWTVHRDLARGAINHFAVDVPRTGVYGPRTSSCRPLLSSGPFWIVLGRFLPFL